ncbi:MAG TPA: ABC transporter substrate-binding protein [Gemmatimonadaceae bacterium]|nr:ABC transporter substrate-binding protein [Gemmatimonadaceae bacterium]
MGWFRLNFAATVAAIVLSTACGADARAPAGASAALQAPTSGIFSEATAGGPSSLAPLSPTRNVKVGVLQNNAEIGVYLAIERGYFHQEGIGVEVVPFADAASQIAALSNNELQFATGSPSTAFFNAAGRDLGMRLVAPQMEVVPGDRTSGLVIRKELLDSGRFKEPSDLRGLRIGYLGPGQVSEMFLERIAAQGGLSLADFDLVQIGVPIRCQPWRTTSWMAPGCSSRY